MLCMKALGWKVSSCLAAKPTAVWMCDKPRVPPCVMDMTEAGEVLPNHPRLGLGRDTVKAARATSRQSRRAPA